MLAGHAIRKKPIGHRRAWTCRYTKYTRTLNLASLASSWRRRVERAGLRHHLLLHTGLLGHLRVSHPEAQRASCLAEIVRCSVLVSVCPCSSGEIWRRERESKRKRPPVRETRVSLVRRDIGIVRRRTACEVARSTCRLLSLGISLFLSRDGGRRFSVDRASDSNAGTRRKCRLVPVQNGF